MERILRFYNRDGIWYADLPEYLQAGGTEEECSMVAGADTWLDYLSQGKDTLFIQVSDKPLSERLVLYQKDGHGATYIAHSFREDDLNHQLWLCSVTLQLFPDYPDVIYYQLKQQP